MSRTCGVSSTEDLYGKWHPFVMREAGHHSRLCQFHDHGRCEGRRTGATGDGAGRAANGIAKEILSHEKMPPTVLVVRFLQLDNQVQMLIDLQIASDLPIIEEAPAKRVKRAESE